MDVTNLFQPVLIFNKKELTDKYSYLNCVKITQNLDLESKSNKNKNLINQLQSNRDLSKNDKYSKILFDLESNLSFKKVIEDQDYKILLEKTIPLCISQGFKYLIFFGFKDTGENNVLKILQDRLFENYSILLYQYDNKNEEFKIKEEELLKIIKCKNVFIIRYQKLDYGINYSVKYNRTLFELKDTTDKYIREGVNLITLKDILNDNNPILSIEEKDFFKNVNNCNNSNYWNLSKDMWEKVLKYIYEFLKIKDGILYSFHPFAFESILESIYYEKLRERGFKFIAWQDDLHYFAHYCKEERGNTSIQDYEKDYYCKLCEKLDIIISPSKQYFVNIKSRYTSKVEDIFYILDHNIYNIINNSNYDKRQNKIILSGSLASGYSTRVQFKNLKETTNFKDLIEILTHPGHDEKSFKKNLSKVGVNYYKILMNYKAAFVGNYKKPLNFLLAKHLEVLFCGCLGFFENNDLLKSQLGLEAFIHYIPVLDQNDKLIEDVEYYKKYLNTNLGKEIAIRGYEYVREKFGKEYTQKTLQMLIKL